MVILHRGFGGQNLGVKFGKFKKADLHHGLRGFWGDLLALVGILGKQATAFIKANNNTTQNTKIFVASIVAKEKCWNTKYNRSYNCVLIWCLFFFLFITDLSDILSYLSELHSSIFNNESFSSKVLHYESYRHCWSTEKFMIPIVLLSMCNNYFQITVGYR